MRANLDNRVDQARRTHHLLDHLIGMFGFVVGRRRDTNTLSHALLKFFSER